MSETALPERTEVIELPSEVWRIAVLGDPHGDLVGLELALAKESRADTLVVSAGDNIGYADGIVSSYTCQVLAERGVRSVMGNHEAWSLGGELFLGPPGYSRELTAEALAWCAALPTRIRIRAAARPELSISLTHCLPNWDYVSAQNARRLLDLEEAQLVLCGHTHSPAIYSIAAQARAAQVERFDPRRKTPLEVALRAERRLVVDAGSLARPSRPGRGSGPRGGGPAHEFGTYALVDLRAGKVSLCSVDKRARLQALLAGS